MRRTGGRCARPFSSARTTALRSWSACWMRASSRRPERRYEVVLVNDGSTDETPAVIERASHRATVALPRSSSRMRDSLRAGTRASRGRAASASSSSTTTCCRLPNFVEEHLRSHDTHPEAIVRGARNQRRKFRRTAAAGVEFEGLQREYLLDDQRLGAAARRSVPSAGSTNRFRSMAGKISMSVCVCVSVASSASSIRGRLRIIGSPGPEAVTLRR